ncbi:MAG: hypothetical protein U0Q20_06380 [Mycobacterium sp.]|nr:hypothetical protein [Mycobacterium sp.]
MSTPTPGHGDLGPELRKLAQDILDRLDPAVRSMAALAAARSGGEPGRCQQVWCPVCALAAVAAGEEHPLLTVVAEHSVGLLAVLRGLVADVPAADTGGGPEPEPDPTPDPTPTNGRYQHIPITFEE